jgi:hypothetical protein
MSTDQPTSGWSREKIVGRIKELADQDADLSYNTMSRERQGLLAAANYHFGSWGEAVTAAGIDYDRDVRRIPKWTPERIVEAIQEASDSGADLSWTSVTNDERYSALAYAAIRETQFGSWDAALEAAGEDPSSVRRYESWNKPKIIRRIQKRRKEGKPLNSKAMQEQDSKLFNAALNYFAGWDTALEAAGLDPSEVYKRRRWSKKIIKKEIKELDQRGEDLAAPNMRANHSPLYSAACKYFGTWTAAREACGIHRNFHKRRSDK